MNIMQMMQSMMMGQMQNNPVFRQAQQMSQGKTPEQLKQTCENLCKQYGVSYDEAWNKFQSQFLGLK